MIDRKVFEFIEDIESDGKEVALIEVKRGSKESKLRYRIKIYRALSSDEIESIVDFLENAGCKVLAVVNRGMFVLIFDKAVRE